MKKSVITAAVLAMSASVAGIAYAAAPSAAPASDDRSVVVPAGTTDDSPGDRGRGRDHAEDDVSPTTIPRSKHPAGDDRGRDDPATHDVGDDHGGLRDRGRGADDPVTHDAGDDRGGADAGPGSANSGSDVQNSNSGPGSAGSGRGGDDDPADHDAGDDHGGGSGGSGGSGRGGADDPANHDAGDDHGSGRHGADD